MALKVITFDFWNTIFDSSGGIERNSYRIIAIKEEFSRLGADLKPENYQAAMKASWEYFNSIWKTEYRTPSANETVRFFWDYLKVPYDEQAISTVEAAFAESVLHFPPKLVEGVEEVILSLREKYLLGIVSDTGFSPGTILRQLLKDAGIYDSFQAFSFSDETGVSKPHHKAFMTILEQLDCPPHSALHVGDIESTDIEGAIGIGMKAIRFSGDATRFLANNAEPTTKANAEIFSWGEFAEVLEKINN